MVARDVNLKVKPVINIAFIPLDWVELSASNIGLRAVSFESPIERRSTPERRQHFDLRVLARLAA